MKKLMIIYLGNNHKKSVVVLKMSTFFEVLYIVQHKIQNCTYRLLMHFLFSETLQINISHLNFY